MMPDPATEPWIAPPANVQFAADSDAQAQLVRLVDELRASQALLESRQQVEAQAGHLATLMRWQPGDTLRMWADRLLLELCTDVQGMQACLYVSTDALKSPETKQMLALAGTYAAELDEVPKTLAIGEGVVGQVAKSRRALFLGPEASIVANAKTGLALLKPRNLMVMPLVHQDRLEGVLELTTYEALTETHHELLRRVAEGLSASLMSIRSQEEMRSLYREAQEKSEQLAAQEEEMRQNMEELQATQDEMRRVQAAVVEREAALRALINNTPDIIYAIDREYRFTLFNEAFKAFLAKTGTAAAEGKLIWETLPHDDQAAARRRIDEAMAGNRSSGVTKIDLPDGAFGHFEVSNNPIRNASGQVIGVSCFLRDVTEQYLEAARAERDAISLHALLNSAAEIVFSVDTNLNLMAFNNAFHQEQARYAIEPAEGMLVFNCLQPENQDYWRERLGKTLAGTPIFEEMENLRPDGNVVYYEVSLSQMRNPRSAQLEGVAVFARDITKRKSLEAELLRQNLAHQQAASNYKALEDALLAETDRLNQRIAQLEKPA